LFARIADVYRRTRKPKDLLWNRFVARPLAAVVLVPLQGTRVTPNQVTLGTLVLFVGAAAVLALDGRWVGLLVGVGLLELAYVFDCVDGQLARLRGTSTPIGAHLDFLMDELKAFLLVAAVAVRLWRGDPGDGRDRWLLEGLLALVAVASAISLTTFLRRPEYAASTGAVVGQGRGDYSGGVKAAEGTASETTASASPENAAPSRGSALSPKRLIEAAGSFVVHYPSYIVFVAIFDRMDVFLHAYLLVNAAHVGRSLLGITWKLGRRAP
jgi:phosphatidylglycerophosphate synthase